MKGAATIRAAAVSTLVLLAGAVPSSAATQGGVRMKVGADALGASWSAGPYAYDGSGRITSTGPGEAFVYDRLGRLRSGTAGQGRLQESTYDAYGNILSLTTDGDAAGALRPCVDAASNRIDRVGTDCNARGTYGPAGNLETYGLMKFAYDAVDVVTESTVDGVRKIHLYSASDERIASIAVVDEKPSWSTWTIRDDAGRVLRRLERTADGAWSWSEDYVYRDGTLLAAEVSAAERTRHFFLDHLGTPRLVTGSGGAEIGRHTYYPFGREATAPDQEGERAKFTGHERDAATLDYMHARYYLPYMGRFLSVDPVWNLDAALSMPQLWNRYAYALNNPMAFVDPTGEVVNLASLTPEERARLLVDLNEFTGNEYGVNENAELVVVKYGENASPTATAFLDSAISATAVYPVVAANGSNGVRFGQADPRTNVIKFDFSDFSDMRYNGIPSVAFGLGALLVHEVGHLHPQPDGTILDDGPIERRDFEVGPLETQLVNRVRAERGLPLRGPAYTGKIGGFTGSRVLINFEVGGRINYVSAPRRSGR